MRMKKRGSALSMDLIFYIVVILILLAGGFGMLGYHQYEKYRDSIYLMQVNAIDTSLMKYGAFHRGINQNTMSYDEENSKLVIEKPAVYPSTLDALKADRDYGTGWFDANISYDGDVTNTNRTIGIIHYEAFDENGNKITSDDKSAYAYNVYVILSDNEKHYSNNSYENWTQERKNALHGTTTDSSSNSTDTSSTDTRSTGDSTDTSGT